MNTSRRSSSVASMGVWGRSPFLICSSSVSMVYSLIAMIRSLTTRLEVTKSSPLMNSRTVEMAWSFSMSSMPSPYSIHSRK